MIILIILFCIYFINVFEDLIVWIFRIKLKGPLLAIKTINYQSDDRCHLVHCVQQVVQSCDRVNNLEVLERWIKYNTVGFTGLKCHLYIFQNILFCAPHRKDSPQVWNDIRCVNDDSISILGVNYPFKLSLSLSLSFSFCQASYCHQSQTLQKA